MREPGQRGSGRRRADRPERQDRSSLAPPRPEARGQAALEQHRVERDGPDLLERQLAEAVRRDRIRVPGHHPDEQERGRPGEPDRAHDRRQRDRCEQQHRDGEQIREEVAEGVHRRSADQASRRTAATLSVPDAGGPRVDPDPEAMPGSSLAIPGRAVTAPRRRRLRRPRRGGAAVIGFANAGRRRTSRARLFTTSR